MDIDIWLNVASKSGEDKKVYLRMDDTNPNESLILSFLKTGTSYEPDVAKLLMRILEPGDTFIDVGANIGYFSMMASALVGPEGKVFSFEPDPKNIERIRYHSANNPYNNVEIVSQPASHSVEEVKFYFNKSSSGGNALWNPGEFVGDADFNDGFSVMKSTTLSDEFQARDIKNVKLVKIDTEGAEHAILRGAKDWLRGQTIPYIVTELNGFGLKKLDSSIDELISFMYEQGYLAFLLFFDARPPQFVCPGVDLHTACISNILFTTPEGFSKVWTYIGHNPGVVIDEATGKMRLAA
jgi:FkbM family methyltransferase